MSSSSSGGGGNSSSSSSGLRINTDFANKLSNSLTKAAATKAQQITGSNGNNGQSSHSHKHGHQKAHTQTYPSSSFGSTVPILHQGQSIHFLAIADFGNNTPEIRQLAYAMNQYCEEQHIDHLDFILGLGDNFYPYGVYDEEDHRFRSLWRDIFLQPSYRYLRHVPWRMVLGNHDYMGEPDAQIAHHYHQTLNRDGLWYMPSNCYEFQCELLCLPSPLPSSIQPSSTSRSVNKRSVLASFYALDTNACQTHVVRSHPHTVEELRVNIDQLSERLQQQKQEEAMEIAEEQEQMKDVGSEGSSFTRRWKILFGHHPLYTQGKGHGACSKCLRESQYQVLSSNSHRHRYQYNDFGEYDDEETISSKSIKKRGFGLEKVLVEGQVDAVFAGHEHVFQYHQAHGIHHFGCGASGADIRPGSGFYQGIDKDEHPLDWISTADQYGFVAVELTAKEMLVRFVNVHQQVLKEVRIQK